MTYRLTPQRMAILRCLEGTREHPSAEDIYGKVKSAFPPMSRATVYNTLELLRRRGDVRELTIDPGRRRYDPDTSEHHHLLCTGCGRIVDITRRFRFSLDREEAEGFELRGNHVEFYGLCPDCRGEEVSYLATFKCDKCGATKEGRCKPKKCPSCEKAGTMQKQG